MLPANFSNTSKNLLRAALLPDVLRLDLDLPAENQAIGQFGLQNGRRLNDPSIDTRLLLILFWLLQWHLSQTVFHQEPSFTNDNSSGKTPKVSQ